MIRKKLAPDRWQYLLAEVKGLVHSKATPHLPIKFYKLIKKRRKNDFQLIDFKSYAYPKEAILQAILWDLAYRLSYRDFEESLGHRQWITIRSMISSRLNLNR